MKTRYCLFLTVLALLMGFHSVVAQIVITSFSQNGVLICSNLAPGSAATVAWASSPSGPWQTNWATLSAVTADSNGMIQVSVPMFYRVLETPLAPAGMTFIPAGSFTMGDTLDGEYDAVPTNVYVSAFFMDKNLVSYTQWQAVYFYARRIGYGFDDAGAGKAANHPVQFVNWFDCVKWCNARSQLAGLAPVYYTDAGLTQTYTNGDTNAVYPNWAANGYRLPTEAEWEKAARGGLSGQRFPWGDTISESQANYQSCSGCYAYDLSSYGYNPIFNDGVSPYTSPVGYFAPNGYGLYDMAGNVMEWCWDVYGRPYGQPTTNNPTGPTSGGDRILRGGSWRGFAVQARCPARMITFPSNPGGITGGPGGPVASDFGFRCVRAY